MRVQQKGALFGPRMCSYLSIYSSSEFGWQVASCGARDDSYIPSLAELEKLCHQNHGRCPFFLCQRKKEETSSGAGLAYTLAAA